MGACLSKKNVEDLEVREMEFISHYPFLQDESTADAPNASQLLISYIMFVCGSRALYLAGAALG